MEDERGDEVILSGKIFSSAAVRFHTIEKIFGDIQIELQLISSKLEKKSEIKQLLSQWGFFLMTIKLSAN